ncbi:MAG: hypothetical protein N2110_05895 [Flavobacteriales bacterium]|nr:hypothetical protein [Flavobacteriales bacterium]MCX7768536.1 hypothetical protein [Flavobacteriales bacterium]MDW8410218.1 hypothetical protein [Flavobacteriales bacterium]
MFRGPFPYISISLVGALNMTPVGLPYSLKAQKTLYRTYYFLSERQPVFSHPRRYFPNVVKMIVLGPARGDLSLHYQRRLSEFCALQAGGGISMRDPIFERFVASSPWQSASLRNVPGPSGRLAVRWFPRTRPALSDFFVSQEYLFRSVRYHFHEDLVEPDPQSFSEPMITGYSVHSLRLLLGWQTLSYYHFYGDAFMGIAFNLSGERFPRFVQTSEGPAYDYTPFWRFYPGFVLGFSMGYAF